MDREKIKHRFESMIAKLRVVGLNGVADSMIFMQRAYPDEAYKDNDEDLKYVLNDIMRGESYVANHDDPLFKDCILEIQSFEVWIMEMEDINHHASLKFEDNVDEQQ